MIEDVGHVGAERRWGKRASGGRFYVPYCAEEQSDETCTGFAGCHKDSRSRYQLGPLVMLENSVVAAKGRACAQINTDAKKRQQYRASISKEAAIAQR